VCALINGRTLAWEWHAGYTPHKILYRRRFCIPGGVFEEEAGAAVSEGSEGVGAAKIAYQEARYHVLHGFYPVSDDLAVQLMGIDLKLKLGAWTGPKCEKNAVRGMCKEMLPPLVIKGKNKKALAKMEPYDTACVPLHPVCRPALFFFLVVVVVMFCSLSVVWSSRARHDVA